jgi:nucleotide-binding universal stress UspA family protein
MISKILVPIDGSTHSKKALEFACELAKKFETQLHLLHVIQPPIRTQTMAVGMSSVTNEVSRKELDEIGRNLIGAARQLANDHECTEVITQVEAGSPAEHIIESAKKNHADLIVMGSRGLSDIAGLLLGSVSHKVTHLAECNCVTIR